MNECTWCHGHLERIEIGGVVIIVCDDCGLTAEVEATEESITCPRCGMTSYNPNDVREGYCGNCHDWTRGAPGRTGEEDRGVRRDSGPA